jgi:hypothetical protein
LPYIILLDDAEQVAHRFVGIGTQFKREGLFGLEVLVRFQAVARDAENDGIGGGKLVMQVAEILALRGTARCAVLGVEIDDHRFAGLGGEVEGRAAGGRQREVGDLRIEHVLPLLSV